MRVEHHGRATFLVTGTGEPRTVDLLKHRDKNGNFNGACDCFPFIRANGFRDAIERAKENGAFRAAPRFRCPHIEEARRVMLDMFLRDLAEKFPDNEQQT